MKPIRTEHKAIESTYDLTQKFYHGTKANLKQGDLIEPSFLSARGLRKKDFEKIILLLRDTDEQKHIRTTPK